MLEYMFGQVPGISGFLLPFVFIGLASAALAQPVASPSSPPATPRERSLLAESFAKEKLWIWQRRLGLQDWAVSLEVVRATDLKPRTLGNIHWDTDKDRKSTRLNS